MMFVCVCRGSVPCTLLVWLVNMQPRLSDGVRILRTNLCLYINFQRNSNLTYDGGGGGVYGMQITH